MCAGFCGMISVSFICRVSWRASRWLVHPATAIGGKSLHDGYSDLNAMLGSVRDARRAGTQLPIIATSNKVSDAVA